MSNSVKFVKNLSPIAIAIALSACGGSGADFGSGGGTGTTNGSSPDPASTDLVFNTALNSKCKLYGNIVDYAITNPTATTVNHTTINCNSGTPLTSAEAEFLERFEEVVIFTINAEGPNGLEYVPYLPNLGIMDVNYTDADQIYSLTDIANLSQYTTLEELNIYNHKIADLGPLSALSNLKVLNMGSENSTIKDVSPIGDLTALQELYIENGLISDINSLSSLAKTTNINLQNNRIEDARPLINWEGEVELAGNCISESLFPVGNLKGKASQYASCDIYDARDPDLMQMGSGDGSSFSEGSLDVVIPTLVAGAKTAVTASLVGPTGLLSDLEVTVTFTSNCIANGQSTVTGPITTTTGLATAEYTAKDCLGEDVITASTTIGGVSFSSESAITIVPADVGSLEFVSSSPASIGIQGSGSNETSVVSFLLKDKTGKPIPSGQMNFSLDSDVGGVTIDPISAISNQEGLVTTTVQAGTVPTTVRVLAVSDEEPTIKTQSEGLVISTGFADQDSFTIATTVHNVEGLDYVDGEAIISISAADAYNNPVPEGTAVYFTPEGGKIEPSCLTNKEGNCSVKWTSTNPKPANGRVTVLATMLGNESIVDSNGNGLLDDGDSYQDMGEAFLDKNENNIFDGEDILRDLNSNGQWDDSDNEYNGTLCNPVNTVNVCGDTTVTNARRDIVLIMSGPAENIDISPASPIITSGFAQVLLSISDRNNQTIPAGSEIELKMIGGGSIESDSPLRTLSTTRPQQYYVTIKGEEVEESKTVLLSVKVTTPNGVITSGQFPILLEGTSTTTSPGSSDTTPPEIYITGQNPRLINVGDAYADAGATAVDDVDGALTVNVVSGLPVDTSIVGNQIIVYRAVDSAGNSSTLTRTVTIEAEDTVVIAPPGADVVLGSVEYVGASPQTILLQGMSAPGLEHTSTVSFLVKDDKGNPIADENVTFSLTTTVGGTRLTAVSATTDGQGIAKATLQSGTVHTSVRVRATVELGDNSISSESSQVIISTGIADQNSLSLSLSTGNPSGWDYDGEKVSVNMYASDRYNNPVPDGTTVSFYTELGQIQPSCQTSNGACSVEWTSTDPRSLGINHVDYLDDGVTTITAAVIGEESFIDTNSNGIFDDGDLLDSNSDRGEAYEDYNKNGVYDAGLEPFLDFNGDGVRNAKDGSYTGLGCENTTLCASGSDLKDIYTSVEVVLAEENQDLVVKDLSGNVVTTIENGVDYILEVSGVRNGQVPPQGTTIVASSDDAEIETSSVTVNSTNRSGAYKTALRVKTKVLTEEDLLNPVLEYGQIKVSITTPKGTIREFFLTYHNDTVSP